MKKKYVSPRCRSEKIDFTSLIAESESLVCGGGGGNGDEGEVRQENLFNSNGASSIWENEW